MTNTLAGQSTAPTPTPHDLAPEGKRIPGIELARALAIIGMLSVHIAPYGVGTFAEGQLYALPHGRASILFVLLAGVGVSLLSASSNITAADARLRLAWRALVLLPLGLALQELQILVHVILQTYALLFVVGLLAMGLQDRWLLLLAGTFYLFGPLVFFVGETQTPMLFSRAPATLTDSAPVIVNKLLFTGSYPLITWAAPFLLGLWLGRRNLRAKAVRVSLIVAGGLTALLAAAMSSGLNAMLGGGDHDPGWARLIMDAPHSQMPLWLIGSTGAAVLLLGLCLLAAKTLGRLAQPLLAIGQLSLSVYVAHLLALHWWPEALSTDSIPDAIMTLFALTILAAVASWIWQAFFRRGPLESLLHLPWQGVK